MTPPSMRAAALVVLLGVFLLAGSSRGAERAVYTVRLGGIVNPIAARYIERSLKTAEEQGASAVILSINTPGGLVSSMQEIVGAITNSKVPVIGLVEPKSAQATSAGALILLATDVTAMMPGTRMGSAHPVGSGENLKGAMEEKATNSLSALAKSLASRRGRSEKIAEGIVRESKSYTAEEAKENGVADLVVGSTDELLSKLDGYKLDFADRKMTLSTRGAARVELPMSFSDRFLDALADPTIASILLSIGVLGIIYELSSPGHGVGAIVGITSLLLGLLSMSALPVETAGVLLLVAGFIAVGIEIKIPSHGLIGLGGVIAVVLGALVLVDEGRYFGATQHVAWRVFVPVVAALGGTFVVVATAVARSQKGPPLSGLEALPGTRGIAKTGFVPHASAFEGSVFVDGARWEALSESELAEGDAVEVVEVLSQPTRLKVKRNAKGDA